jgi:hypothetical protein
VETLTMEQSGSNKKRETDHAAPRGLVTVLPNSKSTLERR